MLSEKRRNILRKNFYNIMGIHYAIGAENDPPSVRCLYQYDNGRICAASACLTDIERKKIVEAGRNSCPIWNVPNFLDLKSVTKHDMEIMIKLQEYHDQYMHNLGIEHNRKRFVDFIFKLVLA